MELKTATAAQLRTAYDSLLRGSFPPAELKPLRAMLEMVEDGCYDPLVLIDGGKLVGACFLWLGVPGWALLDYLCVAPERRNGRLGAEILTRMRALYPGWTILGEAETPDYAPDPVLARRRLGFYGRCGASFAGYGAEAFGVRYQVLYWSPEAQDDETLAAQHRFIYESRFGPEKYAKYVRIPCHPAEMPLAQVPWDE